MGQIGLTAKQAKAASNYWDMLMEEGRTKKFIKDAMARYQGEMLKTRARTIARTETIRASNSGQQALWQQAQQQGLLDTQRTVQDWIITPDDRTCELCLAMPDLNAEGVGLGEPFLTPDGSAIDGPPLHVQCRCAVALRFLKPGE